jgi:hypothetical protein
MGIIAIVFDAFSKRVGNDVRRIRSARLKLFQFVAVRPWLLPAIRQWSGGEGQAAFEFAYSMRIRRGFLSDSAHDDVIDYLVANGVFERQPNHLISGMSAGKLSNMVTQINDQELFKPERRAIEELKTIKITDSMLEGW